jgi:hypothetical protein
MAGSFVPKFTNTHPVGLFGDAWLGTKEELVQIPNCILLKRDYLKDTVVLEVPSTHVFREPPLAMYKQSFGRVLNCVLRNAVDYVLVMRCTPHPVAFRIVLDVIVDLLTSLKQCFKGVGHF